MPRFGNPPELQGGGTREPWGCGQFLMGRRMGEVRGSDAEGSQAEARLATAARPAKIQISQEATKHRDATMP